MKNMSYQKAANIRKKSFISLITEKLVEGNSIGSAIGKTVSEKSAARAEGFKEKFDPLNIVKFMTGGSKLGPAIYGSLAGRSKEDIKYFTGGSAKPVGASATRIESLETANEMVSLLMKIYEFMRATNEEDKIRKEKENNFKEELEYERGLRHKALIEALSGLKPGKTVTATKETDNDFGGIFAGLISFVKGLIDTAISGVMSIVNGIKDTLLGLFAAFNGLSQLKLLSKLLPIVTSPLAVTALTALIAGYVGKLAMEKLVEIREEDKAARPKDYEFVPTDVAKITGETFGQVGQRQKGQAVKQVTPKYARELLDAKPAFTDAVLVEETGLTRSELESELKTNPKLNIRVPVAPKVTSTTKEQLDTPPPSPAPVVQPDTPLPSPEPVVVSPASNVLNEKTKEMNEANLPTSSPTPVTQTTNTTNVVGDKKVSSTNLLPSVRNQEPTFADMILYSTRVV